MNASGTTRRPRRVLLATASVGAGHNAAARAIEAGLAQLPSPPEIRVADVLAFAPRPFRAYYALGYALMVSHFPRIYGLGYAFTNHPQGARLGLLERQRLWQERLALRKFSRYVRDLSPDLVVHTHFLAPPVLARMTAKGHFEVPQFVVITDNDPHRFWHSRNVRRWFLPSSPGVEKLLRWGVDPDSITVSGMPIHPKWLTGPDRRKVLDDWRLPRDRKVVVLSGGTEFTCGPVVRMAAEMLRLCPEISLVVLGGRNKRLLGRLGKLAGRNDRLFPVSFTDRVNELVWISSLMVTKAGGISTAECLAAGAAMLLPRPVPGQEADNAGYLRDSGAAVVVRSYRRVPAEVRRLLDDEESLGKLADNARRLFAPGTATIVETIRRQLGI